MHSLWISRVDIPLVMTVLPCLHRFAPSELPIELQKAIRDTCDRVEADVDNCKVSYSPSPWSHLMTGIFLLFVCSIPQPWCSL